MVKNKRLGFFHGLDKKAMGYFFFGVGVTMFILNLTSIIQFIDFITRSQIENVVPMTGYYVSTVSSVILMTYSLYNIYEE